MRLVVDNTKTAAPAPVVHYDREYQDFLEMRDGHFNHHVRLFRDAPRIARIKKACEDVARRQSPRMGFRL